MAGYRARQAQEQSRRVLIRDVAIENRYQEDISCRSHSPFQPFESG